MAEPRKHDVTLTGQTAHGLPVRLRPMTEDAWPILHRWNTDPEVLYYAEGDEVTSYTLDEVQDLYCTVCEHAFCFIVEIRPSPEAEWTPVGEAWLQEMNLERILQRSLGHDCRRIDLMIGEKTWWGQGIGSEVIRLLTRFGFADQGADLIFGCDVGDYNPRSRRAFEKVGYRVVDEISRPASRKAQCTYDLMITRDTFLSLYQ